MDDNRLRHSLVVDKKMKEIAKVLWLNEEREAESLMKIKFSAFCLTERKKYIFNGVGVYRGYSFTKKSRF